MSQPVGEQRRSMRMLFISSTVVTAVLGAILADEASEVSLLG